MKPTLSIRLNMQDVPAEQFPLFARMTPAEIGCLHQDGIEIQRTLDGRDETICSECGERV